MFLPAVVLFVDNPNSGSSCCIGLYIDKRRDRSIDLLQLKLSSVRQSVVSVLVSAAQRHQTITVKVFAPLTLNNAEEEVVSEQSAAAPVTSKSAPKPTSKFSAQKTAPAAPKALRYVVVALDFAMHFVSTTEQRLFSSSERVAQPYENVFLSLVCSRSSFFVPLLSSKSDPFWCAR